MSDTNVKILSKGCASTGVTEDLGREMFNSKGRRYLAIVELKVKKTHEDDDGNRDVDLSIETIEPVLDGNLNGALDEHVRTIQAALYRNRKLNEGADDQLPLGEEDGPTIAVSDLIQQGQPFVVDENELAAQEAADAEDAGGEEADEAEDTQPAAVTTKPFSSVPS